MRILVTGATGLIGGAVARRLAAAGHSVLGLARSDASAARLADQGYAVVYGDLADAAGITAVMRGVDAVVHAASPNDHNTVAYDVAATRAILDALRGTAKRFVYTSGCLVYGATGDTPATEDSTLHPVDLVRFRQALEGEILAAAAEGVHSVVIRPGWVYGDRGGTAMMMYGSAREHGAARCVGNGSNRWTTVHADDLADLYLLALERAPAASIFNGVYGAAIPLIEIARAASEAAGAGGRVTLGRWTLRGRRSGALPTRSLAIRWFRATWPSTRLAGARHATRSSKSCAPTPPWPHDGPCETLRSAWMLHIAVVWLLVVAFFGAGLFNAIGSRAIQDDFARWGYPRWWCRVTGGLEITSAALIAVPASRDVGMALGGIIIAVAIVTVLRRREFSHAAPLGLFAALLVMATV